MATNKSKSSNKSKKDTSTKSKAAAKSESGAEKKVISTKKKSCFAGFFSKKYEEKESVLTVFKTPKFYGALLGEVLGTLLLALLFFSVLLIGIPNIATYSFALIAILIVVYAFSGACLNPIFVAGMMATRRMSVIRGIMYIIAEIIGAWFGWLIFNGFHNVGGDTAYDIAVMSEIGEDMFWPLAMVEILGAIIIAFVFARALKYKRSVLTFGSVIAGGIALAILIAYVVSAAFLSASDNFIMNPALALFLEIFPTSGTDGGEVFGLIMQALSLYAILPMLGGVVGFYLSDFTAKLSGEKLASEE